MGPTGSPESSVRNYHNSLHNNLEKRSSHQRSINLCILLIRDNEISSEDDLWFRTNTVDIEVSSPKFKSRWFVVLLFHELASFCSDAQLIADSPVFYWPLLVSCLPYQVICVILKGGLILAKKPALTFSQLGLCAIPKVCATD